MFDFFNYLNKARNLKLCRSFILFIGGEKPRKRKKWLNQAAARLTALRQILIDGTVKNHHFKSKLFEGVQVNPQGFVKVVMYEG